MSAAVVPSLAGSGTLYLAAQVRVVTSHTCRYQTDANGMVEVTVSASEALTTWLATLPAVSKSLAGTGAMYVLCQIRPDDNGMRVQVAGPTELNSPWGAEYVCHGWPDSGGRIAAAIAGTEAPASNEEEEESTEEETT